MKVVRWLVIGLVALVVLGFLVGMTLPASHVAEVEATYSASAAEIWGVLADLSTWSEWNRGVGEMERAADQGDVPVWVWKGDNGEMPLRVVERQPPMRMRTEVDGGVFRGSWTYTLEPGDGGTHVRILEEGEIPVPIFRLFMIGRDVNATARDFLTDLGERMGERVEPIVIPH